MRAVLRFEANFTVSGFGGLALFFATHGFGGFDLHDVGPGLGGVVLLTPLRDFGFIDAVLLVAALLL